VNVQRLIGMRVGDGIVVSARITSPTVYEFDVLDDGTRTTHVINTATGVKQ
jgi:hypothetical protein